MKKRSVKLNDGKIPEIIQALLESNFWLSSIETMSPYERLHDDHDGTELGRLNIMFSPDGDARIWIEGNKMSDTLRFRMPMGGGGMSPRTRVALLILAEAIRLDNEKGRL